jgi:hypothetical protein
MNEAGFILLSALFLAIPVWIKYLLAFQARELIATLKRQEREVQILTAQLRATDREFVVVNRAFRQVETQHRHARTRREIAQDRLTRLRQGKSLAA